MNLNVFYFLLFFIFIFFIICFLLFYTDYVCVILKFHEDFISKRFIIYRYYKNNRFYLL